MNKQLIVLIAFSVLCSILVSGCIDSAQEQVQDQIKPTIDCPYLKDAIISITIDGEKVEEVNISTIKQLKQHEFVATHRSGKRPEPVNISYKGVELKSIFEYKGIDLTNKNSVTISAKDGYAQIFEIQEVLKNNHMFIVYIKDGGPLGPMKADGSGSGPFRLVIPEDRFAMRWIQYITEINITQNL